MDFTFSAEQEALRAAVHDVLATMVASGRVRAMVDGDDPAVQAMWREVGDLGWASLLVPEASGGLGLGLVDAVVVLEEMGRVTLPGPFLSSSVCATAAAIALGLDRLLPELAAGTTTGTVALEELGHDDPVERVRTRATRSGGRWELHGLKPLVLDGATADWVVVAARTQEGMGSFLLERPEMTPVDTMDPSRRVARLDLDGTPAEPVGPPGDHTAIWRDISDITATGLAAELVGVCDASLEMAIAYAESRVQFEVPLSSHQVIQHKLVDMLHQTEMARVGVHFAAWSVDVDDEQRRRSVAIAKAAAGEAAVAVTGENIQVHGAVGFTWDADPHLLFKRAKQNDVLGGTQSWHRRRIADTLLSPSP
ncbi:MAG: acyl-CoA dehydrogenase family protein [Acidimicrobiales bacterium]